MKTALKSMAVVVLFGMAKNEPYNGDLIVLVHLKLKPEQRIVHQLPSPRDDTGHIVYPEALFWRCLRRGEPTPRMTWPIFRRLLRFGWIARAGSSGAQDEYGLSEAGRLRFRDDADWQANLFRWRSEMRAA